MGCFGYKNTFYSVLVDAKGKIGVTIHTPTENKVLFQEDGWNPIDNHLKCKNKNFATLDDARKKYSKIPNNLEHKDII